MSGGVAQGGVLLVYNHPLSQSAPTIMEHVDAFESFSRYPTWTVNTELGFPRGLRECRFDVIVLHYSLFGRYPFTMSDRFVDYVTAADALKIAFFQDEHQNCPQRFRAIDSLGIGRIYSLLDVEAHAKVYARYTQCRDIRHTLTGYVHPDLIELAKAHTVPLAARSVDVGYRARPLAAFMGREAQEKTQIAEEFAARAAGSGLRLDVKTGEADRIYGHAWHHFVANCRAMLGVEAGVSIFDLDGEARRTYDSLLVSDPHMSTETLLEALQAFEGQLAYRTISPRVFEAAALRTCLILFEGRYNGVIEADRHYIELKKDFSNFSEVMAKLADEQTVEAIVSNAYDDLIASGQFSYESFIRQFDADLAQSGILPNIDPAEALRVTRALRSGTAARERAWRTLFWLRTTVGRKLPFKGAIKRLLGLNSTG